jgi:two-component system CheB/CheR fusion protein
MAKGRAGHGNSGDGPTGPAGGADEVAGNDPMGPEPTAQPDRQAMPVDAEQPPRLGFPVVGVGASAGGLEAFTDFISAMRPDSGMAFVFIQHLPPERESLIADILAKKTAMLVLQVEDGMEVQADHVYVIRPGHVLTVADGHFRLGEQLGRRVPNRPVDDFFKSLAEEQRERAICVVMSGMGSNGTAGAQAVKAVGGLAIAQDPETAQFPSMPRHLIDQGYADYILAPRDIPEVLLQYAGHPYARENRRDAAELAKRNENHVREILAILRTRTRQDFNGYKKPTLVRRIQRRMGLTRMTEMAEYARVLRQSPSEVRALADDVLIHVTGFFRDADAWAALRQKVIAPLVARREPESEVRAWVTACSSGEEAYSLAMALVEEAERANKPLGIKVFATDMAERPLHHARAGIYPGGIETEIDPQRLDKFFEKDDGVYRVRQFLRECVVFAPQNVLQDPPFSRLDIISCRNLLIYLEPEVQQRVLALLHFGLMEGGALFLGSSETVGAAEELYELVDKKARIFRRVGPTRHGQLEFPLPHAARGGSGPVDPATPAEAARAADRRLVGAPGARPSIALLTQRALLEQHVKAAVTVDRDNRVLYFHGNTRPFLEQPPGEPTRDLMMLARDGLRGTVRVALHRCAAEHAAVTVLDGWLEVAPGRDVRVAVTASPVSSDDPAQPEYFVVSFEQFDELRGARTGGNGDDLAAASDEELRRVRDELQTTIEELQTSNEELKASHEEVMSINEELQSSNEELETSKEEMQSLNEELTTVNAQLQAKMDELQNASNDLGALLTSTSIAVLFLDTSFRRYTPVMRDLMDLIGSDVGRPLSDLHRKFDDPHLEDDARAVLEKLVPAEREVSAGNGRTYARRALPYRTADNRIDGVVVTFFDVTDRKRAEAAVRESEQRLAAAFEALPVGVAVVDPEGRVLLSNQEMRRFLPTDLIPSRDDERAWRWRAARPDGRPVEPADFPGARALRGERVVPGLEMLYTQDDGTEVWTHVAALPLKDADGRVTGALTVVNDVDALKRAADALHETRAYAQSIVETLHEPLLVLEPDLTIRSANPAFYEHFKVDPADTVGRKIYDLGNRQWDIPALRTLLEDVLPANKVFNDYEVTHVFQTLGRRVMLVNGRRLDHVQLILLGVRDVTDRHDAEAALRASEDRLRRMANAPGIGILTFQLPSGTLIDANDAFLAMSGYTRGQVEAGGLTWRRLTPDDYVAESVRQLEVLRQTGRIGPYEKDYLRADGTRSRMLFAGAALGDDRVLEYCIDLGEFGTDKARARESEERFRLIVENVREYAIFMIDPEGTITSWNPGATRVFGYEGPEILGHNARDLFTPEDRDAGEHEKELDTARREGRASDDRWQMRKGGERFWATGVTTSIHDAAGNVTGFIKICRDETRRKQLEEQLRSTNEALERRVAERAGALQARQRQLRSLLAELGRAEIRQRRLLSTELHDNLAQLLAVCKMRASAIEAQAPADTPLKTEAGLVKGGLQEAITYTRGLMADLRPDVLDEHDLAAALEWAGERMARHGLKVEVIDDAKPKPLHEEVLGFLFQSVRELLWNVVKHARTTEAAVRVERGDGVVRVTVEDRGRGFDPAQRPAPTEEGGYGLFSIAERIDLLGGKLDIESARRRGTRVTLTAPLDE